MAARGCQYHNPMPANEPPAKPRLSIVIPVLNEALVLPALLVALAPWRLFAEIIVVDGGSKDGSAELAVSGGCSLVRSRPGRAMQQNAGASAAVGHYILFLHADSRLSIRPNDFLRVLDEAPEWGFFDVRLSGSDWRFRVIERFMCWRSRLTHVATGDQCLYLSKTRFLSTAGFAEIPLMEDVELCKRLRSLAAPHVVSAPVLTSSRRWESQGVLRTVLLMWALRLRYWLGASPAALHRRYYPK